MIATDLRIIDFGPAGPKSPIATTPKPPEHGGRHAPAPFTERP